MISCLSNSYRQRLFSVCPKRERPPISTQRRSLLHPMMLSRTFQSFARSDDTSIRIRDDRVLSTIGSGEETVHLFDVAQMTTNPEPARGRNSFRSFIRLRSQSTERVPYEGEGNNNSLGVHVEEDARNWNGNFYRREHSHRSMTGGTPSNSLAAPSPNASNRHDFDPRNLMSIPEHEPLQAHTSPPPIEATTRSPPPLESASPHIISPASPPPTESASPHDVFQADSFHGLPYVSLPTNHDQRFVSSRGAGLADSLRSTPSRHNRRPTSQDIADSPFAPTPVRPHLNSLASSFEEAPLSPTSRPPADIRPYLDDQAGALIRYRSGDLQFFTLEETAYLRLAERERSGGGEHMPLRLRRALAAEMQEILDRVGPDCGVRREEEWEERARVLGEFERGRGEWID